MTCGHRLTSPLLDALFPAVQMSDPLSHRFQDILDGVLADHGALQPVAPRHSRKQNNNNIIYLSEAQSNWMVSAGADWDTAYPGHTFNRDEFDRRVKDKKAFENRFKTQPAPGTPIYTLRYPQSTIC